MKDGLDRAGKRFLAEPPDEVLLVEVIGNREIGNIDELMPVLQIVDNDDVVMTAVREGLDQVATDKAGTAGDDVHTINRLRRSCSTAHRSTGTLPRPSPQSV